MKTKFTCPKCHKVEFEDIGEDTAEITTSYCTECLGKADEDKVELPNLVNLD